MLPVIYVDTEIAVPAIEGKEFSFLAETLHLPKEFCQFYIFYTRFNKP